MQNLGFGKAKKWPYFCILGPLTPWTLCRQMEVKIHQNSPIDQTTFHMLREVKQVQK